MRFLLLLLCANTDALRSVFGSYRIARAAGPGPGPLLQSGNHCRKRVPVAPPQGHRTNRVEPGTENREQSLASYGALGDADSGISTSGWWLLIQSTTGIQEITSTSSNKKIQTEQAAQPIYFNLLAHIQDAPCTHINVHQIHRQSQHVISPFLILSPTYAATSIQTASWPKNSTNRQGSSDQISFFPWHGNYIKNQLMLNPSCKIYLCIFPLSSLHPHTRLDQW
ncbi:hypothetical protein V8C43DRAFT_143280 [Trichoderma afarasin]